MCGIAGVLHRNGSPAASALLKTMTDAIAHRGPDGEGQFVDGPAGLGHRRLAIIDLSPLGRQPMTTPDGRYTIVFNGEIYNFQELRAELTARGHAFVSRSDSEVLLHAYSEWGLGCLRRLNGMFAFAVWDSDRKVLTLARDRFGVKPIYYADAGDCFLFASEIKGIFAYRKVVAKLDAAGLAEYLAFQNFFTDRTLFEGVRLLPQGSYLQVKLGNDRPVVNEYWDFNFQEPSRVASDQDYLEELDHLFQQAVSRQLISDVEVGSYLSGGMDSGSITALAGRQLPWIRTFTVGFDLNSASGVELGFDERKAAEYMSYLFKTEHYEMVLKAGDMERILPTLAWHLEEPRVGQCYPNHYAARLASKFVKVVLSGCGGDELFAGYPWRYYQAAASNDDFDDYVSRYFAFWQRLLPEDTRAQVLSPIWDAIRDVAPRDIFRGVFHKHAPASTRSEDYLNHSLYFEAKTFLNGLLVVEDKLSMAHGLEARVPFLDNDLADFAMRLPAHAKLGDLAESVRIDENEPGGKGDRYRERTRDGKIILRKMMTRYIPSQITQRAKQGFSAPDASWFKGESIDFVRRRLLNPKARIYDVLDRKSVCALVNDHLEGRENRRLLLWSLLYLEQVFESYL
jgi:asparagine synthase (glutamine-hydrolysing)